MRSHAPLVQSVATSVSQGESRRPKSFEFEHTLAEPTRMNSGSLF
jgi:hypothetical protein